MAKGKSVSVALTGQAVMVFQGTANATSFEPMPKGDPCYALVGQIAAESARIERMLDDRIASVAGLEPPVASCLTSQFSGTNPRFDALKKLLVWRGFPEFEKPLNDMKNATGDDMSGRNSAVHDPWLIDTFSREPHQVRGMRKPRAYGIIPRGETELDATLETLRKRREAVTDLLNEIWERTKP